MADVPVIMADTATEPSERTRALTGALVTTGARIVPAKPHDDTALHVVHDPAMLAHLAGVYPSRRSPAGNAPEPDGEFVLVPDVFPTPGLMEHLTIRASASAGARAGRYCYDTRTPIWAGTWERARAAVDAALTAADLVAAGEPVAYAACEPAGSHAGRTAFGGGCYINNAAVAVTALRAAGAGRVAVLDIDLHHGNGTQSLFYDRGDVFYGSVHIDPAAGWFPYHLGFADERGRGAGVDANRNVPLDPGVGDPGWLAGVAWICAEIGEFGADAVVLSLGTGACAEDPGSPLAVTTGGYATAGGLLRELRAPTVVVREGGAHPGALAAATVSTLDGLAG